jgi:hypothetical protein
MQNPLGSESIALNVLYCITLVPLTLLLCALNLFVSVFAYQFI